MEGAMQCHFKELLSKGGKTKTRKMLGGTEENSVQFPQ